MISDRGVGMSHHRALYLKTSLNFENVIYLKGKGGISNSSFSSSWDWCPQWTYWSILALNIQHWKTLKLCAAKFRTHPEEKNQDMMGVSLEEGHFTPRRSSFSCNPCWLGWVGANICGFNVAVFTKLDKCCIAKVGKTKTKRKGVRWLGYSV